MRDIAYIMGGSLAFDGDDGSGNCPAPRLAASLCDPVTIITNISVLSGGISCYAIEDEVTRNPAPGDAAMYVRNPFDVNGS